MLILVYRERGLNVKHYTHRRLVFGLALLFAGPYAAQAFIHQTTPEQTVGPAAVKGRTAELGKPVPTKQKIEKEVEVIMNDPAISSAWGLKMTEAQKAWRITQGSKEILVCIIDTGVDQRHPDLVHNLWKNPGEQGLDKFGHDKATNGIDDDGDGYVDNVNGWNFVANNNNVNDEHGHGTHIAGIIGAEGGNGIGISGVSPKVSMMILKYYDAKGTDVSNLINTVKAIDFAVNHDCNIINYSGGGLSPAPEEKAAIERANKKGILFVAAAGNERSNSDDHKYYPADYGLPNILSVTAINRFMKVLPSSNYGEHTVQIAAPGNDIISTLPGGQYGYMTGTSQATAFATGVAALVMANNASLRKADLMVKYLTKTGDVDENLIGKTAYARRLNSYNALAIQDQDLSFNGAKADNAASFRPAQFAIGGDDDSGGGRNISAFGRAIESRLKIKTAAAKASPNAELRKQN